MTSVAVNIFIRSIAFVIAAGVLVPQSYRELRRSEGWLGRIPLLLFLFWVFGTSFILSSIFFVYLGFEFLGTVNSIVLLFLSLIAALMYSGGNIAKEVKDYFNQLEDEE